MRLNNETRAGLHHAVKIRLKCNRHTINLSEPRQITWRQASYSGSTATESKT